MIRVERQPEPEDFDRKVRQPGRTATLANPDADLSPFWRKCLDQLWEAYGGICAYLAIRIPPGVGTPSVDHLIAKSDRSDLAYEWDNFRLACLLMNARKGKFDDVLDPFEIEDGWFTLEMSSLEVLPNPALSASSRARVQATIDRLKLNDPECTAARAEHYDVYLRHLDDTSIGIPFGQLQRWSPFVAKELIRQGLVPP